MEARHIATIIADFAQIVRRVFTVANHKIPYADINLRLEPGTNGRLRCIWKVSQTDEHLLHVESLAGVEEH